MKKWIGITAILGLLAGAAFAQELGKKEKTDGQKAVAEKLKDPLEILKKVDAACLAVKAVRYDILVEGDEVVARNFPKIEASVLAAEASREGPYPTVKKYAIDLKYARPGSENPRHVTAGSDGENYFLIDHGEKKAYADIDPAVLGSAARALTVVMMIEYLIDQPFDDEMTGKERMLLGCKTIEGEECYELRVVYANDSEAIWYFSTKDYLPRCRVDTVPLQDETKGKLIKTVKKLDANPKIDEHSFKLKLPEGYAQTDDFAP